MAEVEIGTIQTCVCGHNGYEHKMVTSKIDFRFDIGIGSKVPWLANCTRCSCTQYELEKRILITPHISEALEALDEPQFPSLRLRTSQE